MWVKVKASQWLNVYSPWKIRGMFHVGVQIGEQEWTPKTVAVSIRPTPLVSGRHQFNQSLPMPPTHFSATELQALIEELKVAWSGSSYDILERDCCHFPERCLVPASRDRRHSAVDIPWLWLDLSQLLQPRRLLSLESGFMYVGFSNSWQEAGPKAFF